MLHFDTLRYAGVATAAMSGLPEGDCVLDRSSENERRTFLRALGHKPEHLVCPRQVHGIVVAVANGVDAGKGAFDPETALADADAIITSAPGLPIGITIADCVPIALYDPRHQAIGLIHAGRRGTQQNIAANTLNALAKCYYTRPEELLAVIGPSAGPCCYEVSQELADAFTAVGLPAHGRHLDLWAANHYQLTTLGVLPQNIHITAHCTICGQGFHSYRKHKTTARNLMVLCLPQVVSAT